MHTFCLLREDNPSPHYSFCLTGLLSQARQAWGRGLLLQAGTAPAPPARTPRRTRAHHTPPPAPPQPHPAPTLPTGGRAPHLPARHRYHTPVGFPACCVPAAVTLLTPLDFTALCGCCGGREDCLHRALRAQHSLHPTLKSCTFARTPALHTQPLLPPFTSCTTTAPSTAPPQGRPPCPSSQAPTLMYTIGTT